MTGLTARQRRTSATVSVVAVLVGALAAASLPATPADADGFFARKGAARGDNGFVGRSRGGAVNGEGAGFARRGGLAGDGQGNGVAGRGLCGSGQNGAGCRGGAATWNADGSVTRQGGAEFSGANTAFSSRRFLERGRTAR